MTEGPGGVGAGGAGRAVPVAPPGQPFEAGSVDSRQGVEVLPRGDDAGADDADGDGAGGRAGVGADAAQAGRRPWVRALRTHFGTLAGVAIIGVLLWRMGTGVFLDGLRRIDTSALLLALAIGGVTTVSSAWRWALVARGLKIRLPLGAAVGDYYRALFLNAALPGGILGDVHRAVRHGQSEGDVGRGVRAVFWERAAGQIALAAAGLVVLLAVPSPVAGEVRHAVPLALLAGVGALAVLLAVRMNRTPSAGSRRGRAVRGMLAEAREALLSRRNGPGVALSSLVVLAGHIGTFVLAARVAGASTSAVRLLPLAVLALLAMGVPLNVGGWGPREGVTAWAFGAAGLGADTGFAVSVVYGVLCFVAALPGVVVLVWRWWEGVRGRRSLPEAVVCHTEASGSGSGVESVAEGVVHHTAASGEEPVVHHTAASDEAAVVHHTAASGGEPVVPHTSVSHPTAPAPASSYSAEASSTREVSSEKYAPKESTRLARSRSPFSAEPSEGRPMTPESV